MKGDRTFRTLAQLSRYMRRHPGAWHVLVLHDDGCPPVACRCRPDFVLRPMSTDSLIEGARLEVAWRKKALS